MRHPTLVSVAFSEPGIIAPLHSRKNTLAPSFTTGFVLLGTLPPGLGAGLGAGFGAGLGTGLGSVGPGPGVLGVGIGTGTTTTWTGLSTGLALVGISSVMV